LNSACFEQFGDGVHGQGLLGVEGGLRYGASLQGIKGYIWYRGDETSQIGHVSSHFEQFTHAAHGHDFHGVEEEQIGVLWGSSWQDSILRPGSVPTCPMRVEVHRRRVHSVLKSSRPPGVTSDLCCEYPRCPKAVIRHRTGLTRLSAPCPVVPTSSFPL